jgi:hypothetical protein
MSLCCIATGQQRGPSLSFFSSAKQVLAGVFSLNKAFPVGMKVIIIIFIASGVGLSPLHCGHFWPNVPAPDDR